MTTSTANDYPSAINTLERMLFHNVLTLQATIGQATFNLDNGLNAVTPFLTMNLGRAADKKLYAQTVLYLPVSDTIYSDNSVRPWMHALEISDNAYPTAYKS